jgi:hypothetical protein
MSNPYQAPKTSGIPDSKLGLAGHVPVIAVLLIIQGVLEIIGGLMALGTGVFMALLPSIAPQAAGAQQQSAGFMILAVVYLLGGVLALVLGVLKIWAGWKNRLYRGRTLGITAISSGFVSLVTCYCGPTGLGLAIYGLIVYLNDRTTEAFALGEQGYTPVQIRDALS